MKGQLEHTVGVYVVYFAVRCYSPRNVCVVGTTGTYDKLADATARISYTSWILGPEAFIYMVMTIQNDVSIVTIE